MFEINVAQLAGALSGAIIAVFVAIVYKMMSTDNEN
jgi:hypothetical protein